jgi:hypothetical protein
MLAGYRRFRYGELVEQRQRLRRVAGVRSSEVRALLSEVGAEFGLHRSA